MPETQYDIVGKTCMVTGATSGIGLVTARTLAEKGAHVVLIGRNEQKTEIVLKDIKKSIPNASVDAFVADLSEFNQVRQLAQSFTGKYRRLDVLVNNAGAYYLRRQENSSGVEQTFALNHLAYFLLTNLLLNVIKSSAPARIVNVSSDAHVSQYLDFNDLQMTTQYSGMKAYGRSKLANLYFTYELARRLDGSEVTVNAVHPGFVATNMGANNFGALGSLMKKVINIFAGDVSKGAQTVVYLASSPDVAGITGKYYIDCEPATSTDISYDEALAKQLWEVSASLVGLD